MANVSFKHGLQEHLDAIRQAGAAVEGAFYFTTDTHRLYKGQKLADEDKPADVAGDFIDAVPVNEGVTSVEKISDLPIVTERNKTLYTGQFYYITQDNILCVYNGSGADNNAGWVQLNANTDTSITALAVSFEDKEADGKLAKISITDTAHNIKEAEFGIKGEGGTVVEVEAATDSKKYPTVKIKTEEYEIDKSIEDSTLSIVLSSSDENKDDISVDLLTAGDNITISDDGIIAAHNTSLASTNGAKSKFTTTADATNGYNLFIADSDNNGLTAKLQPEIQVGKTPQSVVFQKNVASLPVYTREEIDEKLAHLDSMTYKGTVGTDGAYSSLSDLITSAYDSNTTSIRSGDTYKLVSSVEDGAIVISRDADGTPHTSAAQKGDLLIATGEEWTYEEYASGQITADLVGTIKQDTLVWSLISSGENDVITYKILAASESDKIGFTFKDSANTEISKVYFEGDDLISLSQTPSVMKTGDSENKKNTIIISHNEIETTTTPQNAITQGERASQTFTAITGIVVDDNNTGHIKEIQTTEITVNDTNAYINSNVVEVAKSQKDGETTASIKNTVNVQGSDNKIMSKAINSYDIISSSLNIDVTAGSTLTTTTAKESGTNSYNEYSQTTAPKINIDLVWGEF